jgi:hypothetical protein
MKNGRMNDYPGSDLMAAILDLRDATAAGFARQDANTERLRADMNRRFDLVDERFDRLDERFDRLHGRVAALEPHGNRPTL